MATTMQAKRGLPSWLLFGGLAALLVGERLIGSGSGRWLSALGALAVLASVGLRAVRVMREQGDRRMAEQLLLVFSATSALALFLYALQSDVALVVFDRPLERGWPKLSAIISVLWPVLLAAAVLSTIFVEQAFRAVARAPKLEIARIRDAALTGLGLAGCLTFAFSAVYVATQRDTKFDLSYFRTTRPGESSRKIIQNLDQPLDVSIFYPPSNEVREEVEGYFQDLAKESPQLRVAIYDNAVDIAKAKELNVTANGMVVISRGGRKESLNIGLELESARTQLRNLDKEVQKRLLQVGRPARTVYLTTGHGERGFDPAGDTDKRPTLRDVREALQSQSYVVRTLGMSEGLGVDVPGDASLVAIIGPQQEFLPEELAALDRYLDKGGHLLLALEPDPRPDPNAPNGPPRFDALLAKLGLKFDTTPLANDQVYGQRTYQKSDRGNIATAGFSSHPSVTSLGRMQGRAHLILLGAGHFEELKERPPGLALDITVRAHGQTFVDTNRNFTADPGEQRKTWDLAAAAKRKIEPKPDDKKDEAKKDDAKKDDAKKDDAKKDAKKDDKKEKKQAEEMRAIVLADADALSDLVLPNPGNAYFFLDGVRWLVGDESIVGEVSSETDVPISHTRKQDQVWFYACVFLMPALVLAIGALMTRRRRMGARATNPTPDRNKEAA